MGFSPATLFTAPEINPINKKARSIPFFNVVNVYGRVFFFSWFGFFLAFWSWYAFPPLLNDIIKKDLGLTKIQVLNSNIISLCATLIVRLVAGPCCDRFGPRLTFAGCLLIGALPTWLAGTAYNVHELYALRFFIGILGGSFVPCQVWTTGFYDKNIVGTANSITAGLGNAGGGITYFIMPAVYKSLVSEGLTPHVAWRVSFIVPGILITAVAIALVLLCPDTPTGKWADREQAAQQNLRSHSISEAVVDVPGSVTDTEHKPESTGDVSDEEKKAENGHGHFGDHEAQMGEQQMVDTARGEVIKKPTFAEMFKVCTSPQTLVLGACYFSTFGMELSVNSNLGTWYEADFKKSDHLGLSLSGDWAAMFGLMNIICRPLAGVVGDIAYKATGKVWSKKALLHAYGILAGVMLVAAGATKSPSLHTLTLLIGIGVAFFMEGANGLVFSVVPHVHPYANGVVSGFTGASGNLGGVIYSVIFRYVGEYGKAAWIIGIITIALHVLVCWVPPIPKGQIGGR